MNRAMNKLTIIGMAALTAGCISTIPEWNAESRETTLKWFLENEYGVRPPEAERPSVSFAAIGPDVVMMDGAAAKLVS